MLIRGCCEDCVFARPKNENDSGQFSTLVCYFMPQPVEKLPQEFCAQFSSARDIHVESEFVLDTSGLEKKTLIRLADAIKKEFGDKL